jgi:hypothetical protein
MYILRFGHVVSSAVTSAVLQGISIYYESSILPFLYALYIITIFNDVLKFLLRNNFGTTICYKLDVLENILHIFPILSPKTMSF